MGECYFMYVHKIHYCAVAPAGWDPLTRISLLWLSLSLSLSTSLRAEVQKVRIKYVHTAPNGGNTAWIKCVKIKKREKYVQKNI